MPRPRSLSSLSTVLMNVDSEKLERVMDSFRRWGYLQADLDPVGHFAPLVHPDLDLTGEEADAARRIYCGSIGVEFMHIADPEKRRWVQERMESELAAPVDRARVLDQLVRADAFRQAIPPRRRERRRTIRTGHEPPRAAERHHQHRKASGGGDLRRL